MSRAGVAACSRRLRRPLIPGSLHTPCWHRCLLVLESLHVVLASPHAPAGLAPCSSWHRCMYLLASLHAHAGSGACLCWHRCSLVLESLNARAGASPSARWDCPVLALERLQRSRRGLANGARCTVRVVHARERTSRARSRPTARNATRASFAERLQGLACRSLRGPSTDRQRWLIDHDSTPDACLRSRDARVPSRLLPAQRSDESARGPQRTRLALCVSVLNGRRESCGPLVTLSSGAACCYSLACSGSRADAVWSFAVFAAPMCRASAADRRRMSETTRGVESGPGRRR